MTRQVTVYLIPHDEFVEKAREQGFSDSYRGFSDGQTAYVCEDHHDLALIAHEVGHCLGRTHTWLPGIMNPTGALRMCTNWIGSVIKIIQHWRQCRQ